MATVAERFVFIAMGVLAVGCVFPVAASLFGVAIPGLPSLPLPPSNPFNYQGNPYQSILSFGDWVWASVQAAVWLGSTPSVLSMMLASLGVCEPWLTVVNVLTTAAMTFFALMLIGRVVL